MHAKIQSFNVAKLHSVSSLNPYSLPFDHIVKEL